MTETGDSNPHMLKGVLIRALAEVLLSAPYGASPETRCSEPSMTSTTRQIDLAHQDARVGREHPVERFDPPLGSLAR